MKQFSLTRYLECLKWTLRLERSHLLRMVLVYILCITLFMVSFPFEGQELVTMLWLFSFLFFSINTASMLHEVEKPGARLRMLMMPCSKSEKYLARVTIYSLGALLITVLGVLPADVLQWSICSALGRETAWMTPAYFTQLDHVLCFWQSQQVDSSLAMAIFNASLCLVAGVTFRRIGFAIFFILSTILTPLLPQDSISWPIMALNLLLTLLLIAVSFNISGKTQYITRKWLQF